ncbi:hypothetical protein ANN_24712 [Periplaneta americana]|uniref:PiggyBac transposable element-derived protein domain-containing protein n=1 Tax=Periplaneta americana TaxID=6978 RepID=A0ABQ8RZL6_PERAM|nr:hypothetical protein ANN_24712 [Periplaneta americana]
MCLVKKPSLRDYWTSEPILRTTYTKTVGMSRDRFLAIFTMLHLNDNERRVARDQPAYDPLYKIKPFLNILTTRFRDLYTPDENLTIDEAISIKWRDVRDVYLLSTAHDDHIVQTTSKGEHQKIKPIAVVDYNKFKIGVDKSDRMLSYYSFQRKSLKWWKRLFFHLFDLALVNAHILHHKKCVKKLTLHKFIAKVAESLVMSVGMEMTIPSRLSTGGRLVGRDHFPHRIPGTGSKQKGHTQRTCKVCADRGKHHTGKATQKYTTIYCARCDVGLCIGNCFEIYHTRANYWE